MSDVREQSRAALRQLVLPVPERERTLRVIVPKGTVPPNGIRCLCAIPAVQAWRAAAENKCTKIRVEDGTGHKHEFEVSEILRYIVRQQLGFIPPVNRINGQVPAQLATRGHEALGNVFENDTQVHVVPAAVSGTAGRQGE